MLQKNSQLKTVRLTYQPSGSRKCQAFWIKTTQQAYYSSEFKIFQAGKRLKESHALSRLTAIIDHAGILRVGGRLQNSQLDADSKHPAILPKESQLAQLIISHAHSRTMHGGTQLTLSLIRKSCWIVGGRAPVKSVEGQNATIRFGRGRRPRGPTYARGTIRSLFETQEQARQRKAFDVATHPPCRNLFRDAHFEIIQFVCVVNQVNFSLSVQGSFFVDRFTFSFAFSFTFGFRLFLSRFHFRVLHCRVLVPAIFGAAGTTHVSP
jgi:hypothetical protein